MLRAAARPPSNLVLGASTMGRLSRSSLGHHGWRKRRRGANSSNARRGGNERIHLHVLVAHGTDQLSYLLDASLVAPSFEIVNDADQGRRITETRIADPNGAGAGEHIFNDILGVGHSANSDNGDFDNLG